MLMKDQTLKCKVNRGCKNCFRKTLNNVKSSFDSVCQLVFRNSQPSYYTFSTDSKKLA